MFLFVELDVKLIEGFVVKVGIIVRFFVIIRGVFVFIVKWIIDGSEIKIDDYYIVEIDSYLLVFIIKNCLRKDIGEY